MPEVIVVILDMRQSSAMSQTLASVSDDADQKPSGTPPSKEALKTGTSGSVCIAPPIRPPETHMHFQVQVQCDQVQIFVKQFNSLKYVYITNDYQYT